MTDSWCGNDPTPFTRDEAPVATHDGMLWPFTRPTMRDPVQIVRRMADDIRMVLRRGADADELHRRDLRHLGWSEAQIDRHCDSAVSAFLNSHDRAGAPRRGFVAEAGPLPIVDAGSAA